MIKSYGKTMKPDKQVLSGREEVDLEKDSGTSLHIWSPEGYKA